jgi:hypothetical protein
MIGTSTAEYVFIKACIYFLRLILPLSFTYCVTFFVLAPLFAPSLGRKYRLPWYTELWFSLETLFYLLCYLPYNVYLQRDATHPALLSRQAREKLFRRCHDQIPDPELYLSKWFLNAPVEKIKRDNVKDFILWAFFNRGHSKPEEEEEIDGYLTIIEGLLGRKLEEGRGDVECLRLTLDRVETTNRSLLWYFVSTQPLSREMDIMLTLVSVCVLRR